MVSAGLSRWRARARRQPELVAVLAVGLLVRMVLIPITHGQDFVVWDKASAATLDGVNVYATHPHYPGGPYAYFPLFLDIELPFRWLAEQVGLPFTVLGKLPILAGDVATALLIAVELIDHGAGRRAAALGAALFFLNPLVLYNSAWYGRFDSIGCALLLLALRQVRRRDRSAPVAYALAVAAKTFPIFLLAGVVRRAPGKRAGVLAALAVVIGTLSLPYLGSWRPYLHDILLYDTNKPAQGLSWQRLLLDVADPHVVKWCSHLLLACFVVATVWLSRIPDLHRYAAVTLVLFLVCSNVVLEQYLLWPLPLLIIGLWTGSRTIVRASAAVIAIFTGAGMVANESLHPWGRSPWPVAIALAVTCLAFVAVSLQDHARAQRPAPPLGGRPREEILT